MASCCGLTLGHALDCPDLDRLVDDWWTAAA